MAFEQRGHRQLDIRDPRGFVGSMAKDRLSGESPAGRATARSLTTVAAASRATVRARTAILVGDLRGFSRLACKLHPDTAVGLLQEFFASTSDVAVAHGADIDRVIGDVFVLLFRPAGARRDDCVRAVRTGLAVQRSFLSLRNRWKQDGRLCGGRLGLSIGVATGQMVFAEIEDIPGVHSLPFGEPLSRATRLCQQARGAEILVDDATYCGAKRLLDREVTFTSREIPARRKDVLTAYRAQLRRAGLRVVSRRFATDPVCGRNLTLQAKTERRDYSGAVFHFCSAGCAERFVADPPSWI